jgi:hypothetical protein
LVPGLPIAGTSCWQLLHHMADFESPQMRLLRWRRASSDSTRIEPDERTVAHLTSAPCDVKL